MAAHGRVENNTFTLSGLVATLDGATVIKDTLSGPADSSAQIGLDLAERLIAMGSQEIIESLKEDLDISHEG
jgi:hydroxymethylbilane synthase